MEFSQLNIDEKILSALKDEGYETPSLIQAQAIPSALLGKDILGCAQTGTGKTAAFAVPILQRLNEKSTSNKTRALVLTPTRELALQIHESFLTYGKNLSLKSAVVMGGVSQAPQVKELKNGLDILTATPGRLLDLIYQGYVELSGVEVFVLDEADRMLDMGFFDDVKRVIELIPQKKQTLFFTATMPPDILRLANSLLVDPVNVTVTPVSSTVDLTEQFVCMTDKFKKTDLLIWLLKNRREMVSTLVFSRTKHGTDKLAKNLSLSGIRAVAIHGDKTQTARQMALDRFKAGRVNVLVATDIAARGIDIDDLSHVVNFDLPQEPETYIHRIGRTGRAGKSGVAISLCSPEETKSLRQIERLIKKNITPITDHPFKREKNEQDNQNEANDKRFYHNKNRQQANRQNNHSHKNQDSRPNKNKPFNSKPNLEKNSSKNKPFANNKPNFVNNKPNFANSKPNIENKPIAENRPQVVEPSTSEAVSIETPKKKRKWWQRKKG